MTKVLKILCASLALTLGSPASAQGSAGGLEFDDDCTDVMCKAFEITIRNAKAASGDASRAPYFSTAADGSRVLTAGGFVVTNASTCTKTALIPRPIYQAVLSVMRSLDLNDRGVDGAPVAFTPAQQTMLLFYTTLMQQTLDFNCAEPAGIGVVSGG